MKIKNLSIIASLVTATLIGGCAGSVSEISRRTPQELKASSTNEVCSAWAYKKTDALVAEIASRGLDCGKFLKEKRAAKLAAIEASRPKDVAGAAQCEGIEYMGLYSGGSAAGLTEYRAKIRNNGSVTRIVKVWFIPNATSTTFGAKLRHHRANYTGSGMQGSAQVGGGQIKDIHLDLSDRKPTAIRITSCE